MEGHEGWNDYAAFYDWENARTLGRRDVPFWRNLAVHAGGAVLELGCGTGRISIPLGRAIRSARLARRGVDGSSRRSGNDVRLIGIDRSEAMLAHARRRVKRAGLASEIGLVQGDIRSLPFPHVKPVRRHGTMRRQAAARRFSLVIAPYGILQSLLRERDLALTLAEVHRVLEPGGTFGLELVADLPSWEEYRKRVSLEGWRGRRGGAHLTLVETVRQDPRRRRTIFDQEFTERRGRVTRVHRFSLAFRTLSVPQMGRRLAKAGFEISALLGDYRGGPWDPRAEVWIVLARKRR